MHPLHLHAARAPRWRRKAYAEAGAHARRARVLK
jgi:hypothetical protein